MINNWKRRLLERVGSLFEKCAAASKVDATAQAQIDELHRQIGHLKVERDSVSIRRLIYSCGIEYTEVERVSKI